MIMSFNNKVEQLHDRTGRLEINQLEWSFKMELHDRTGRLEIVH